MSTNGPTCTCDAIEVTAKCPACPTAADQTPATEAATAAQALAQAVREAAAENIPLRWLGKPDLASSYWEGYRAAAIELADLLDEPALLDQYPALGAKPAPQPAPAKRCGECRLGLGVHTTTDPYCDHHKTPATDSERVGRLGTEAIEDLTAMIGSEQGDTLYMSMGMAVALRDEVTHLLTLLAEQAATIERVQAVRDKHWGTKNSLLANEINAALGSQRTEGQG